MSRHLMAKMHAARNHPEASQWLYDAVRSATGVNLEPDSHNPGHMVLQGRLEDGSRVVATADGGGNFYRPTATRSSAGTVRRGGCWASTTTVDGIDPAWHTTRQALVTALETLRQSQSEVHAAAGAAMRSRDMQIERVQYHPGNSAPTHAYLRRRGGKTVKVAP